MTIAASSKNVALDYEITLLDYKYRSYNYIGDSNAEGPGPQAFFNDSYEVAVADEKDEYVAIKPHFHTVRQFQVVTRGDAVRIGKNTLRPFDFHYADPSRPYGPIMGGQDPAPSA